MTLDNADAAAWRSIGRHAARRGTALAVVLTNNAMFDCLIREGYAEATAEPEPRHSLPAAGAAIPLQGQPTDLFGHTRAKPARKIIPTKIKSR